MLGVALAVAGFVAGPKLATGTLPHVPEATLAPLITRFLRENAPKVRIALRYRLGAHPPVRYVDMQRAGLLTSIEAQDPTCNGGPAYALSVKGRSVANALGWSVSSDQVLIPIGRFRYVPGSAKIGAVPAAFRYANSKSTFALTFETRFAANANSRYLLSLGPSEHWPIAEYNVPPTSLPQDGSASRISLMLQRWNGVWQVARFTSYGVECSSQ